MKKLFTLVIALAFTQIQLFAQPSGEVFPDFTVVDIEGNTHHLQEYLDDGKTVLIDVFATWCGICINSLPAVDALYEEHGPNGDNTLIVLSFEKDPNTTNEAEFVTTYNVPNPVISDAIDEIGTWNTLYQPNFFVVCADGSFTYHFSGVSASNPVLANMVADCNSLSTGIYSYDNSFDLVFYSNPVVNNLVFEVNAEQFIEYSIIDLSGKILIKGKSEDARNSIDVSSLESGVYFFQINEGRRAAVTKKFIKQ
jgi:thiol-disulfide isomerase/thioredoxin